MIEMLEKSDPVTPPGFNIEEIMDLIPHRYPFLLVDKVVEYSPRKWAKGYKNVSMNEPIFTGHFPGHPIFPGVLIIEALAQLGSILLKTMDEGQGKLGLFAGIDNVRFRRQVVPGDRLDLYVELLKIRPSLGKAYVKASVDEELVADGEIMFFLEPLNTKEAQ